MAFPLTKRGEVVVSSPNERRGLRPEDALSRLEAALEDERPTEVERRGLELHFRANFLRFVSNSNLLVPVDCGSFVVSEMPAGLRVSYELSFRRLFVIVTCMVTLFLGPLLVETGSPHQRWREVLPELLVAWTWLFGSSYVLSAIRFPRFIRRVLAGDY